MHWTDRRRRFRALLSGTRCVHPGSVFDPISARIAEDLGFEVGMFARSVASLAVLGAPDLAIVGRTSALAVTGLEDAIARARAYEAAGVDAMFMLGIKTRAQLEAISAAVKIPLVLGSAAPEMVDLDYLGAQRVRVCLQGHQPFMAAVQAAYDTLKALREGTPPAKLANIASPALMKRVTRDDDYTGWTRDFLGG